MSKNPVRVWRIYIDGTVETYENFFYKKGGINRLLEECL
jgi:hypothetical protein